MERAGCEIVRQFSCGGSVPPKGVQRQSQRRGPQGQTHCQVVDDELWGGDITGC